VTLSGTPSERPAQSPGLIAYAGLLSSRGVRLASALVGFDFEADSLAFIEGVHARPFDRADVDENVPAAALWCDEAIALLGIEEFHSSDRHVECPWLYRQLTGAAF
jgi:hypothetical protein